MSAPETLREARRADLLSKRRRDLADLVEQRRKTEELIAVNVNHLRRLGASWAEIGRIVGVSRQAAEQRYSVKKS